MARQPFELLFTELAPRLPDNAILAADSGTSTVWYARAAEHGSADAQVALATAYYLGRGAALDMSKAAHWFRAAANGGAIPPGLRSGHHQHPQPPPQRVPP